MAALSILQRFLERFRLQAAKVNSLTAGVEGGQQYYHVQNP